MSRPDLCFATSSRRKSLSRRCRFSIASSTVKRGRTPRNSATSPRHGFRSTIDGRPLRQPRQLDGAVDRDGRRAGAALRAEEHVGDAGLPGAGGRRRMTRRGAPHGAVERLLHRPRRLRGAAGIPGKELVRAGPHRLKDQVGLGGRGDREDRRSPGWPARRRSIAAIPDDASPRMSTTTPGPRLRRRPAVLDDADRHAAGAQQCARPAA